MKTISEAIIDFSDSECSSVREAPENATLIPSLKSYPDKKNPLISEKGSIKADWKHTTVVDQSAQFFEGISEKVNFFNSSLLTSLCLAEAGLA